MRSVLWKALAVVAVVAAIVVVVQVMVVQDCYYLHGEPLLDPGQTPAPTPTGMENGYYCVPPDR